MNNLPETSLACVDLGVNVPGRKLVEGLNLQIVPGEVVAILGPNGVGKSLTMHTLAALRSIDSGHITLCGEPVKRLSRQQIATRLALLPQDTDDVFPTTVLDTVLIGRHPHIRQAKTKPRRRLP